MELQIITLYFFADEILKANHFYDDPQAKMTTAEIITATLTAATFFCGNQRRAACFLKTHRYIPNFLSESRFNRKLHGIPQDIWQKLFSLLAEYFKAKNVSNEYVIDSFPVPICDNIRIFRSKIFSGKQYRGYIASKKRFFFGIKVHLIATTEQEPVEFLFAPGSEADMKAFTNLDLDLGEGARIYADRAYNSYEYEDFLKDNKLSLVAERKANSKRPLEGCLRYLQSRAVTSKGFELKVFAFILAYSCNLFFTESVAR